MTEASQWAQQYIQTIAAGQVHTAQATATNPGGQDLLPEYVQYFGAGSISVDQAYSHWHGQRNPFIPGSARSNEFVEFADAMQNRDRNMIMKLPEVPIIVRPSKRRMSMPRLKPDFETLADIRLRLCGTCIFIGSALWYVRDVRLLDHDYILMVEDGVKGRYRVPYRDCPHIDLRSPEPQYFVDNSRPAYLIRKPDRQQRQGICAENAYGKYVAGQTFRFHHDQLIKSLGSDSLMWSETLSDLMLKARAIQAIRLSKDVAVYLDSDDTILVEYRGRKLGNLKEDTVTVNEGAVMPWIRRDVNAIGCKVRT